MYDTANGRDTYKILFDEYYNGVSTVDIINAAEYTAQLAGLSGTDGMNYDYRISDADYSDYTIESREVTLSFSEKYTISRISAYNYTYDGTL